MCKKNTFLEVEGSLRSYLVQVPHFIDEEIKATRVPNSVTQVVHLESGLESRFSFIFLAKQNLYNNWNPQKFSSKLKFHFHKGLFLMIFL